MNLPHKKPTTEEERTERKRWIIGKLKSGVSQVAIASELGVTRQAVSRVWKDYEKEGEASLLRTRRGKPREVDTLSPEEVAEFVNWLKKNTPESIGEKGTRWTLRLVKRAISKRLNKSVRIPVAYAVCRKAFPIPEGTFLPPEVFEIDDDIPDEETVGKPESTRTEMGAESETEAGLDDFALPSLEEMEKINKRTAPETFGEDAYGPMPSDGVRTGKHAKGKRTPRQKPKRKKRR